MNTPIQLRPCPKAYTRDLDKCVSPRQTIERVRQALADSGLDVLAETRRVDTGRLGIPVYLSVCGRDARRIMPTRKQMGKGSSAEQAQASALMELMERYAFFSFWEARPHMVTATWQEAEQRFGSELMPVEEILRSVDDTLAPEAAREVLSTVRWSFYPATRLADGQTVWTPLDWFKLLGEFNGTSAGNSAEESLLQGLRELVERHACCRIDRERPTTPSIDMDTLDDPVLADLCRRFAAQGIRLVLGGVEPLHGLERGLEPFVQVGGVVGDDVHHNLDAVGVRGFGETVEVVHRAQTRVHVAVVVHVIAAVGQLAGVEGAEPDRVHAEFGQVVDLLGHAVQVTQAGAGGILERTRVDLVDHGLLPPVQLGPVGARLAGRPHGVGHVGHRRLSFPISAVSPVM